MRTLGLFSVLGLIACQGSEHPQTVSRDSAGVIVVENHGPDVPLGWNLELVATVRSTEDGVAMSDLFEYTVDADTLGHTFVLNSWFGQRVQVIDTTGKLVRIITREGAGPGEVGEGVSISSSHDGVVSVADQSKSGIVRIKWDGKVLPGFPLAGLKQFGAARTVGDTIVIHTMEYRSNTSWPELLQFVTSKDTATLIEHAPPRLGVRTFCGLPMEGLNPMLTPDLRWHARGGRVVVNHTGEYTIHVFESGRLRRLIRRNIEPLQGDEVAVRRFFPEGKIVADRKCVVSPAELVRKRGVAPMVQPIRRLSIDYRGIVWAERNTYQDEPSRVDVFDGSGGYLGTLSGFGAPLGFPGRDLFVFAFADSVTTEPKLRIYRRR